MDTRIFKKQLAQVALFFGILAGGGYIAATPFLTAGQLAEAIEQEDHKAIKKMIDFPAVRERFKESSSKILFNKNSYEVTNPFARLGNSIANLAIGPIVDQAITPEALIYILAPSIAIGANEDEIRVEMNYTGINTFEVLIWKSNEADDPIKFIMVRRGLTEWVVNNIDLSISELVSR